MANEDVIVEGPGVDELVESLGGAGRRQRQEAAHLLAVMAHEQPEALLPHAAALIDALQRPEALTRWEILSALTEMATDNPSSVADAYEGAESSLFDEDSAVVRLAAFRFLVRLGASEPARSDVAWTLLNEAVQCYHGDPEYRDMLIALTEFAGGDISDAVRDALVARVTFDATNGRGYVRALSSEIVSIARAADA